MLQMDILVHIAKTVKQELGTGFSEAVYHQAFLLHLRKNNIQYESERILPITLHDHVIGSFRCDIIVENNILIELKSIESKLRKSDINQVHNYLRFLPESINHALLVNFGRDEVDFMVIDK